MPTPRLVWDCGTAYDLFVSLLMLHKPVLHGLRGAWAAGVRSRLAPADREILQQVPGSVKMPSHWVHTLRAPKDGATALKALKQIPPAQRLAKLASPEAFSDAGVHILNDVAQRGAWTKRDRATLRSACEGYKDAPDGKDLDNVLKWWSRAEEFGERYFEALHAYHTVFFAEEETRIQPALAAALERAQRLAKRLAVSDLLEELSQGLRFAELPQTPELALAPSFWATPLIVEARVSAKRHLILFGARPQDASLVPGEVVPDALFQALKALSDPTRLRILRYLAHESLTPTQLAQRLRLRAPTVVHHLYALRIAGLVQLTVAPGNERHYRIRSSGVAATLATLKRFLKDE